MSTVGKSAPVAANPSRIKKLTDSQRTHLSGTAEPNQKESLEESLVGTDASK